MKNLKGLNIKFKANESSQSEVTDSIRDLLTFITIFESVFIGGFSINKLISKLWEIAASAPIINEVINDFPVFWKEFKSLSPEDAIRSVNDAKKLLEEDNKLGKVATGVIILLGRLASSYRFIKITHDGASAEYEAWSNLELK